jgi:hypothetical protein
LPQVTGGFARQVYAIERVGVDGIKEESLGQGTAGSRIGKGDMRFKSPTIGKEQAEAGSFQTEIYSDLQTMGHERLSFR